MPTKGEKMAEEKNKEENYHKMHREHIMKGREASGNKGGRPRLELKDQEKTVERLNRDTVAAVARTEGMSEETLRRRLKELEEKGVIKKVEQKWKVVK